MIFFNVFINIFIILSQVVIFFCFWFFFSDTWSLKNFTMRINEKWFLFGEKKTWNIWMWLLDHARSKHTDKPVVLKAFIAESDLSLQQWLYMFPKQLITYPREKFKNEKIQTTDSLCSNINTLLGQSFFSYVQKLPGCTRNYSSLKINFIR